MRKGNYKNRNEKLFEIGNEITIFYGDFCYEFEILKEEELVKFSCMEKGERFYVESTFKEMVKRDKELLL